MSNINNRIMQACSDGIINEYMRNRLSETQEDGITESILDELFDDAQYASDVGVKSDRDYNIYFNVDRLSEDMANDTFGIELGDNKKKDLCYYIMSHSNDEDYKFDNLVDYRILMHKWLCDRISKSAYPNTEGKTNREPTRDVDKWVGTLKKIYALIRANKANRQEALDKLTANWDPDEKFQFSNWMRYYEDGTTEKYNVKTAKIKQALNFTQLPSSWDKRDTSIDMSTYKKPEPSEREIELQRAKQYKLQMRSRLRSLRRLLEKFSDILPAHNLDNLRDEIHALEKSIVRLNAYGMMQDCTIRSANKMRKLGFDEGADFLYKVAAGPVPPSMPSGPDMQNIITNLENISRELKSRDLIRELSGVDIALNSLGVAAYFPELSFAQSKLIESFGYASNKVEDIIAKLRGSGEAKKEEKQPIKPPMPDATLPELPEVPESPVDAKAPKSKIDTGEILNKPVGKVEEKLPVG